MIMTGTDNHLNGTSPCLLDFGWADLTHQDSEEWSRLEAGKTVRNTSARKDTSEQWLDTQALRACRGYLSQQVVTLPEVMRDAGYHTIMTGKW